MISGIRKESPVQPPTTVPFAVRSLPGLAWKTAGLRPGTVTGMALALALLAFSQAMAILLVKGFIVVFFGSPPGSTDSGSSATMMTIAQLFSLDTARVSHLLTSRGLEGSWPGSLNGLLGAEVSILSLYWIIPVCVLSAGLLKAIATYLYNLLQQEFSLAAGASLRDSLFASIIGKTWPELAQTSPGGWMSIVINDVAFVQARLSDFMTSFLRGGISVFASVATLAVIHWPSALALAVLLPLGARATGRTGKRIAGFSAAVQDAMRSMAALVLEFRARFDFMRAQSGEGFDGRRFAVLNDSWLRTIQKSLLVRSAFAPVLEFAGFCLFAAFVWALDHQWIGGGTNPSGFAFQFLVALGFIVKPLREIGEQLARYHETKGAVAKCLDLLDVGVAAARKPETDSARGGGDLSLAPAVELRRFGFSWPVTGKSLSFGDLQQKIVPGPSGKEEISTGLSIQAGKSIAVIGPSGSGKSTLLKVIGGLARPGTWDCSWYWDELAGATALVPQQPYLFAASIRENVCYGREDCRDEEIWAALRMMDAEALVASLTAGLETPVSSLTANLSGGQMQRLVIARALLRNRPLLLLDEATSALDAATEGAILQKVITTVRDSGRAVLAVTHRLQWLGLFDEVWFVEDGCVSMHGAMDRLMENTRFRQFCQVGR